MKGRAVSYSAEELGWIEERASLSRRALHEAFVERFGRNDVSLANIVALCKRRGWFTGRDGRFHAGQKSWNAGRKGECAPGSEKGWFRKGERRGVAARLYKPIGTERLSKEGYLERKIHDGLPLQSRWRAVHRIRWEELHGPLAPGMALKCLDGDKTNTDPANWKPVSRALLPLLNGGRHKKRLAFDEAEPEIKPLVFAAAELVHAAGEARKRGGRRG